LAEVSATHTYGFQHCCAALWTPMQVRDELRTYVISTWETRTAYGH